ncbi:Pseudouridine-5'-monophosphatase [Trichostrongylus colubriformis]|uniref:Pseudouridine-5'-monophosphatase n=1 Tax=Trichostrongylus colubriformis TaxID=6319 RepID=A0AAN8IMJ8_TRICO
MTSEKPSVTHVIFDFDGLLVDTEPSYTLANQAMLNKFGKEFTMELKGGMMGRKNMEAIAWLLNEVGIADRVTPEEYAIEYDALLAKMFRTCHSMPGAERLVRHFARKGVPMAICTGSCSRTFAQKAEKHRDWIDLIPIHVLSGDDESIKRGKPFPDPFLETMKRFPNPPNSPSHVLVFEDAPNGVKAAQAAGMQCVMVPDLAFHKEAALLWSVLIVFLLFGRF